MSEHEQRLRDALKNGPATKHDDDVAALLRDLDEIREIAELRRGAAIANRALLADVAALRKELDEARAETRVHDNVSANLRTDFRMVQRALADEQDKTVKLAADLARVTEERNEWKRRADAREQAVESLLLCARQDRECIATLSADLAAKLARAEGLLRCVQREIDAGRGVSEETAHGIDAYFAEREVTK